MSDTRESTFDYRAAFIGPQGENADEMERLILEVLRDHVMWRRNFHPEDPRLVAEWARSDRPFRETTAQMRDALYSVLGRLKRGAPLHSPRQLAHMVTDPALPALVGYFAGMLYNQNNVVQEVAPETVRCEREYMAALARMVGYPPLLGSRTDPNDPTPRAFGHLASGGTSANMEVLWTARNVRYFPLALRLWLAEADVDPLDLGSIEVSCWHSGHGLLKDASTRNLMDLSIPEIVSLKRQMAQRMQQVPSGVSEAVRKNLPTIRRIGLGAFLERYHAAFPTDRLSDPVVLISHAAHYCWHKAMDLTGLGSARLVELPVDRHVRLDVNALSEVLQEHQSSQTPVLMVVSIAGTTETASIDPVGEVNRVRDDPESPAFWHHCDGAFGGYFASLVERQGETIVPWNELGPDHPGRSVLPEVYEALCAIGETDSVVLDPHKLGFLPYPGGALLYRDYPVRDAIAFDAPYLTGGEEAGFGGFLGRWTLEGSRPGAAAVSGYLTQKVIPLSPEGHGLMAANALQAHLAVYEALEQASGTHGFRFAAVNGRPDTLGSCFVLLRAGASLSLSELNRLTNAIWSRFTVDEHGWNTTRHDYLFSKSTINLGEYPIARDILFEDVVDDADGHMDLLRVVSITPFLYELTKDNPVVEGFARRLAERLYAAALEAEERLLNPHELLPIPDQGVHNHG